MGTSRRRLGPPRYSRQDCRLHEVLDRALRAKIEQEDFDDYASRLRLTKCYSTDPNPLIRWPNVQVEEWWNPPDNFETAQYQYSEGDEYFSVAIYHKGYVYFAAFEW